MKQTPRPTWQTRAACRWLAVALVVVAGAVTARLLLLRRGAAPRPASAVARAPAAFVGSDACAACHRAEHDAWKGSQHARAMQHASAETVRGDFGGKSFTYAGVRSNFFKRDGRFFVRIDGPDGRLAEFEVKYTFGLEPLQQYLVELPGGRLQALSIAWDTRAAAQGGQRWFHLYPGEKVDHRDELHWTKPSQNWNYMCADCHSTDLRKGYDGATDRYATRWSEMTVGCEACHGPGSAHVAWARSPGRSEGAKGLAVTFDERRGITWRIDAATGAVARSKERPADREIEVCAQCHARRAQIAEGHRAGDPLLDHYLPSLLESGLYQADGQQRGEVYIWGSFLQSRMYREGVTCSDCHDPYTQKLRAEGNAVCALCHVPSRYDTRRHHFHDPASPAGKCVSCHMPATDYMLVDPRLDHSLRVPRPDLSASLGVPNACDVCHRGRGARWAADAVRRWYGRDARGFQAFAQAFHAAEVGGAGAAATLGALASDGSQSPIARASALARLGGRAEPQAAAAARAGAREPGQAVVDETTNDQQEPVPGAARLWRAITRKRSRLVDPTATTEAALPERKRFQRLRPAGWISAILGVAGILDFFYQPHRTVVLPDGTILDIVKYGVTRDISINISSGERKTERQLVVVYWSDVELDSDMRNEALRDMRNEALRIAPMFYRAADASHVDALVLKPTYPGFTRTFPVIAYAGMLRVAKDQTGVWREAPIPKSR